MDIKNLLLLITLIISVLFVHVTAQNIWEPTNGPNGFVVSDFIITSKKVLVLSIMNSGVWFSNDNGLSWQKKYNGLDKINSYATSLASSADGSVYAVVDKYLYLFHQDSDLWFNTLNVFSDNTKLSITETGKIYAVTMEIHPTVQYSFDGANSFKAIMTDTVFHYIGSHSFHGNGNNYFVAPNNIGSCIYRMSDNGASYKKLYQHNRVITKLIWHPFGLVFFTLDDGRIIRMDKTGGNITALTTPEWVSELLITPVQSLMIITRNGEFISNDLGATWSKSNTELYKHFFITKSVILSEESCYFVSDYCNNGLSISDDNGKNWRTIDFLFQSPLIKSLKVDISNNIYAAKCYGDEFWYTNTKGATWSLLKMPGNSFYSDLITSASGKFFIIGNGNRAYESADHGNTWNKIELFEDSTFNLLKGDQKYFVYLAYQGGNHYVSNDGGDNWEVIPDPPSVFFDEMEFVRHPDGELFALSKYGTSGIYISENNGISWNFASSIYFKSITSYLITDNGNVFISGTNENGVKGLFISTDKLLSIDLVSSEIFISLCSDPNNVMYGITETGRVKYSVDDGLNWLDFSEGLIEGYRATSLAIDKDNYLYLSLNGDVVSKTANSLTAAIDPKADHSNTIVQIQPNPVESKLTVTISDKNISSGHYKIIDLNSIVLLEGDFQSSLFTIDCSSFANGLAFIQIFGKDNSHFIEKLIIAH